MTMTILAYVLNADGTVDWWTTVGAARDFWVAFAGLLLAMGAAIWIRNRTQTQTRVGRR